MSNKPQQKNQLEEKKPAQLAQYENSSLAGQELDSEDFIIPRILLMQGTSEMLSAGNFNLGDIVHSANERKLAGKGETVEIIPFYVHKTYETFKKDGGDWIMSSPWGSGAPDKEWEETINHNGETIDVKNMKNYNIYVLIAGEEDSFPCLVSFRSSAGKEAKKITSHFMLTSRLKKPAFNVAWELGSEMVSSETVSGKKTFQKYTLKKTRPTTNEEMENASQWLEAIATNINKYSSPPIAETVDVVEKEATKEIINHAPKATPRKSSGLDAVDDMPF